MSALRKAVELEMRLRGLSPKTHQSYIHAMEELARFYGLALETLVCAQVQRYLDHLITVRKLAWSTINVYFSAYRFLYTQVLRRTALEFSIPPRGRSGKRPSILSREEVVKLIESPPNVKHRALLSMVYGSGLRVSEVVKTQPIDVDRGRMMLKVNGKGHKDRYTILSMHTLKLLEEHWRTNRPSRFSSPVVTSRPLCPFARHRRSTMRRSIVPEYARSAVFIRFVIVLRAMPWRMGTTSFALNAGWDTAC